MTDFESYRADFERLHTVTNSYGHRRSRKGTYVNPAMSRDWKWFCYGLIAGQRDVRHLQKELNRARA